MKGAIMTSGGGGTGKLFAAISVSYPENSTLTCTCQETGKKFTAKTKTGKWIFNIPYEGNWTVESKLGEKSKSKTEKIEYEGQLVSVTILYAEVLFDGGDVGKMSIGFSLSKEAGLATLTVGKTVRISSQSNGAISYMSNEKIDLADYKVLKCTNVASSGSAYLVISSNRTANPAEGTAVFVAATTDNSLPLDAYNGEYFVGIACGFGSVKEISQLVLE